MTAPPFTISTSDRALLLALRGGSEGPSPEFWSHLAPAWRVALRSAWEERFRRIEPAEARESLAAEHRAEALPDPRRIDPSWYARALRDESPAVRAAVLANAEGPLGTTLRSAFGIAWPDAPPGPVHPRALAWVLSFWTERLVGGPPPSFEDPPAIRAIATLPPSSLGRLLRACGQRKLGGEGRESRECDDAGLGLLGRLLSRAEPFRVRWALQHLPYDFAKQVRGRIVSETDDLEFEQDSAVFEDASDMPGGGPLQGDEP